ncbi:hypothetical protein HN51_007025 [Arachis hypogaea]|uniref:Protein TPX2 isoform X2 n=2 Tax=Arachis TaxID=3817 RepID=A0A6P4DBK8_ARADU|nr:protein TPX2 isoform X2 [Arachis duranensis]XP_025699057.1 protein TPX2 isoform X2 [Arachis hypogaea]QHO41081.1 hypothetical protein DS421_5g142620 [Arachis hypogaea]
MMMTTTTMEEEEEDMEIENDVYVAHEIDLDYEFDAARFFDFTVQESPVQARLAELWFETAASYPPSPFVSKLVLREDDVSASSLECFNGDSKSVAGVLQDIAMQMQPLQVNSTGLTFTSKTTGNSLKSKAKSTVRKGSTLMKPTASQLAKQNRAPQNVASRFQKLSQNKEMNLSTFSGVETQASKRQKLEDGHSRKVGDVIQQTNFVHKAPNRIVTTEENSRHTKLRITIPREPELETAHRAQRIRPKNVVEAEHVTVAGSRFKARPLNRKILNAPTLPLPKRSTPQLPEFQEFHLKTWERAMQHSSATSSSLLRCNDSDKGLDKPPSSTVNRGRDLRRPSAMTPMSPPKHDGLDFTHNFKARPLNRKILSSRGDIGVFRNRKQESTVPTEFNFQTEKRVQHNLPIELFSKLSLTSEIQSNNGSHINQPHHSMVFRKDLKENISSFHLNQKDKPFIFGGNKIHSGNEHCMSEVGSRLTARSLGIR